MSKGKFTKEQNENLQKNPNVERCSPKSITYKKDFKAAAVMMYQNEGIPPREIFRNAGFDLNIIGKETPKKRVAAWKKLFRNKGMGGLSDDRRGKSKNGGRPRTKGLTDKERIEKLEATVAYLKAENDFLAKLRSGKTE